MQKISTQVKKTDLKTTGSPNEENNLTMQPSDKTLQLIMQFAANYRAIRVDENQYVDMNLS